MKDYQQYKVYSWESSFPEGQWVPYDQCQSIIDYIWFDMKLKNSPRLKPLLGHKWAGKANRLNVFLPERGASTKTIIHELAHSMTMNVDGLGHQHGPRFVGVYMVMLEKYIKLPMAMLVYTAKKDNVDFDLYAKPAITDEEINHMIGN